MRRLLLFAAILLVSTPALAEDPAERVPLDPDEAKARAVLIEFLDTQVKAAAAKKPAPAEMAKKLAMVRKFIHPKTLEVIADQEKKKVVTNALAVWFWARNDYWLKHYELTEVKPMALGAYVGEVQERSWRVEEGGEDGEPEPTSYLLARHKGKWVLVDKKRNTSFTADAIRVGYREYFDVQPEEKAAE